MPSVAPKIGSSFVDREFFQTPVCLANDEHEPRGSPARSLQAELETAFSAGKPDLIVSKYSRATRLGVLVALSGASWTGVIALLRIVLS